MENEAANSDPKVICALILSDGAIREMGTGKVSIFGMFNAWNCPVFPFQTPPFFITVCLSNVRPGTKTLSLVVRIEQKQTGLVVGNVAAQIGFLPGQAIDLNTVLDMPFPVPGIQLPQPGAYRVVVLANDEKLDERHLQVNLAKPIVIPPQFPPNLLPPSTVMIPYIQLNEESAKIEGTQVPTMIVMMAVSASATSGPAPFYIAPSDEVPESFARGMQEIQEGKAMDFDQALGEPPPPDDV